jgi:L-fuconolactonase
MIIDTHCHASTRWYEPVETLLFNMDRNGVDSAVLIPLLGAYDSADMIAAVRRYPDRVVWFAAVDPVRADVLDGIRKARDAGARGLRMRAGWRSEGARPMALWEEAEALGLAVSLVGPAASFVDGALGDVAAHCSRLPLILEHLGGLARPDVGDREAMLEPVCALASHPNLSIKLPGLGQLASRTALDHGGVPLDLTGVRGILDRIFGCFGSERIMWGSDFPPVAAREGYGHALHWTREFLADRGETALEDVFGGVAARLLR